ncbi:helix-turn-helix domain-containing protein [Algoriella sp.]|uniref:helix-turn-helix domain-containing protein n=1 Tax=Algoriella sp. TaxID=1872434 RepID=UPI001B13500F|nr:helix-turn-helix domain-containing protein [Algoriella sp.]MBO6212058.1 helix-turn-helix domain-containing protein [Algoriella sp.]
MSKLKIIREQQNLTQEELSEKSGISVRTIQRIEAGTKPKGHTLKTLSKTLEINDSDLLTENNSIEIDEINLINDEIPQENETINFSKIKLINLSSILFIIFPPLNILTPLLLSYLYKEKNNITKQIISVQIIWTISAPIIFMLGIFLKLGRQFTLVLIIAIVLSNLYIILRNALEIDRNKKLYYKLNFNII